MERIRAASGERKKRRGEDGPMQKQGEGRSGDVLLWTAQTRADKDPAVGGGDAPRLTRNGGSAPERNGFRRRKR